MEAAMIGPNVLGEMHTHVFTHPYRGYLMCSEKYCGHIVTRAGEELTADQHDALRIEIANDY